MEPSRVAAIPFFADLPEDELAAVAGLASEVEIASGQDLADEGRIGHSLFAIESRTPMSSSGARRCERSGP
jgi:hypothetical protein